MIDYIKNEKSNRFYSGTEKKIGLIINGEYYFVKFRKNSPIGQRYNDVSEYIGSQIFQMLGVNAQETSLGLYDSKNVVVIKDFLKEGEVFIPFNGVGDSSLEEDKDKYQYSYEDIGRMLKDNLKSTNVEETIDRFWDMFIIDALIGNFDRHGSNWGFIKKDNKYRIAPVFDNGSSLYPSLNNDNEIEKILSSEDEINKRIYNFPKSQVKYHGEKSFYDVIIKSLEFEECNNALERIYKRIKMDRIEILIDSIEIINGIRKKFYKTMLKQRYEKIIMNAYNKLRKRKDENS